MTLDDLIAFGDQLLLLGYRVAGYALLNLADDAALLAMMFC